MIATVVKTPFPIEQTNEKKWAVRLDKIVVVVQKLSEAELLAYLPVEHYKIESDSLMKPDVSRVRKIVALCKQYQYSSSAARRLETWLADQPRQ